MKSEEEKNVEEENFVKKEEIFCLVCTQISKHFLCSALAKSDFLFFHKSFEHHACRFGNSYRKK